MKNKKRHSLFKTLTIFGALLLPAVVAAACGTPQSNKYVESVAAFNNIKLDPNSSDSPDVTFNYTQLVKDGTTTSSSSWNYLINNPTGDQPTGFQVPDVNATTKLTSTYGLAANSLAYSISRPAAVFATSATNYNITYPDKDNDPNAIHLFAAAPGNADQNIVKEFYQANANNLLIGDRDENIGFGITDISFKFNLIDSTTGLPTTAWDPRMNNTQYPLTKDEYDKLSDDNINNRLTKMLAVTDIHIYFRFFIAGTEGSGQPTRDAIIAPNNTNYDSRVNTLKQQWKNNFGEDLNTYAFDLQMQDMTAQVSFSVTEKTADTGTTYSIEPNSIISVSPLALYTKDKVGVSDSKQNSLKMDPSLLTNLTDYSKIMTLDQFPKDAGSTDPKNYPNQQTKLTGITNAFLTEVRQTKPVVTGLKTEVIGNNELGLTIEDYFNLYFKSLATAPDGIFGKA